MARKSKMNDNELANDSVTPVDQAAETAADAPTDDGIPPDQERKDNDVAVEGDSSERVSVSTDELKVQWSVLAVTIADLEEKLNEIRAGKNRIEADLAQRTLDASKEKNGTTVNAAIVIDGKLYRPRTRPEKQGGGLYLSLLSERVAAL